MVAAGQSSDPQVHGIVVAPAASGVSASVRRWVVVRGSSGHTVAASCIQLGVEGRPIRRAHAAPDLGRAVLAGLYLDMAVQIALLGHPHRLGVKLDDHPVDQLGDLLAREFVPRWSLAGQLASILARTAASVIRSVRKTAAAITRKSTRPATNTAPSFGNRSINTWP